LQIIDSTMRIVDLEYTKQHAICGAGERAAAWRRGAAGERRARTGESPAHEPAITSCAHGPTIIICVHEPVNHHLRTRAV
jgi:hypothetical protein